MDTDRAIRARRTIRDFEPRPIDRAALDRILEAGLRAAMHDPKDGRRFIVKNGAVDAYVFENTWGALRRKTAQGRQDKRLDGRATRLWDT